MKQISPPTPPSAHGIATAAVVHSVLSLRYSENLCISSVTGDGWFQFHNRRTDKWQKEIAAGHITGNFEYTLGI